MSEQKPLGLFAVFYDGETRPAAGFVLEQDAERFAKGYSGGEVSYEIKHVHVADDLERAVVEAAVKLAETSEHIDHMIEWDANEDVLLDAARALIAARESVEKPITYSREDIYFDHD